MEYPVPPGYDKVVFGRYLLVALIALAAALAVYRCYRWKYVRPLEAFGWIVSVVAFELVSEANARCQFLAYDSNGALFSISMLYLAVVIVGVASGLFRVCVDGTSTQKTGFILGTCAAAAVIGLFLLLLRSAPISSPLEARSRSQCRRDLKYVGWALHNYTDKNISTFPPSVSGAPPVSWRVTLLPYLDENSVYRNYHDEKSLYRAYDRNAEWNVAPNAELSRQKVSFYTCGSNYNIQDAEARYYTCYSLLTGPQAIGGNPQGTKFKDISDGISNTVVIVEACGAEIVWTEPRDIDLLLQIPGINVKGSRPGHSAGWVSSYHHGGSHVLLADGTCRFISSKTDPRVLKKLCQYADGPPPDDY